MIDTEQDAQEFSQEITRIGALLDNHPGLGEPVQFLLGAIIAMLQWRTSPTHGDDHTSLFQAILDLDACHRMSGVSLRGYYRNDATVRLAASYERLQFLVWVWGRENDPDPLDDLIEVWRKHKKSKEVKIEDIHEPIYDANIALKHWGLAVGKEEVIQWPDAVAALRQIITYLDLNAPAVIEGYNRACKWREARDAELNKSSPSPPSREERS